MNGVDYTAQIRYQAKATSATFLDADIVRLSNIVVKKLSRRIDKVNNSYFSMDAKWDLVAGQRQYELPEKIMLRLEKTSIMFPTWPDYRIATQQEMSGLWQYPISELSITQHSSDQFPKFFLRRNSFIFLTASAIPDMTDGLWVEYKAYPSDISTATLSATYDLEIPPMPTAIGIPLEIQDLVCDILANIHKGNKDRPMGIMDPATIDAEITRVMEQFATPNIEQDIVPRMPYWDDASC